jgi:hypothetical protein
MGTRSGIIVQAGSDMGEEMGRRPEADKDASQRMATALRSAMMSLLLG